MKSLLHRSLLLLAFLPCVLIAQDPDDPPDRAGRISALAGTVAFQAAGLGDWAVASLNYTVTSGDRLFTNRGARAEMEVGPFAVRLADTTDLTVVNLTDHFVQLALNTGTLRLSVYRLPADDSMEVDTPHGALFIRRPGHYRISTPLNGRSTFVTVDGGTVELQGPGVDQVITGRQSVELTGSTQIRATLVTRPRDTEFDVWSADRDRRVTTSDCSRYVNSDIPGCADLNDYGRWDNHPTYGHVWYPSQVSVGWVPYQSGQWEWIGPWGWTWVDNAPWGYAPFHYGRWVAIGAVWVWAPGPIIRRPCYSPAFVSFVGTPRRGYGLSIGVSAWFPLGPREPYYPWYRHSQRHLRDVNYSNVRNVTNINVFIDSRRREHINYANREQATTALPTGAFPRVRSVGLDVNDARDAVISRTAVARNPWSSQEQNASPVIEARRAVQQAVSSRQQESPRTVDSRTRLPILSRSEPSMEARAVDVRERVMRQMPSRNVERSQPWVEAQAVDVRERVMRQMPARTAVETRAVDVRERVVRQVTSRAETSGSGQGSVRAASAAVTQARSRRPKN